MQVSGQILPHLGDRVLPNLSTGFSTFQGMLDREECATILPRYQYVDAPLRKQLKRNTTRFVLYPPMADFHSEEGRTEALPAT